MTSHPHPLTHLGRPRRRKRRYRVLVLGLPYFGTMLAEMLTRRGWDARFAPHPGRDPQGWLRLAPLVARADIVYLVGSRMDRGCPQEWLLRLRRRRPTVIHWVGTDVQIAAAEHARGNASKVVAERAVHWCDAPWLADELDVLGVGATYVQLPVMGLADDAPPLLEAFRVLLYLPVDAFDREVFDMETLLRLPDAFPAVEFVLVPSTRETLPRPLPANVSAPGWVTDMDALYRAVSVVVRLTSHDGTSFMVLEALSRGRQVIWTFAMPGVTVASGFEAVAAALGEFEAEHDAGRLSLNVHGMRYAREAFDPHRAEVEIDRRLRALLKARRGRKQN